MATSDYLFVYYIFTAVIKKGDCEEAYLFLLREEERPLIVENIAINCLAL